MSNIHQYKRSVHYYETDQMGIVHHSNYIRWFEEARVYMLDELSLPYDRLEAIGVMIPVLGVECDFKMPVRFGDAVLISCNIESFSGVRISMEYRVTSQDGLHAFGKSCHAFVDKNMKPLRLKRAHPEIYDIFENEIKRRKD